LVRPVLEGKNSRLNTTADLFPTRLFSIRTASPDVVSGTAEEEGDSPAAYRSPRHALAARGGEGWVFSVGGEAVCPHPKPAEDHDFDTTPCAAVSR